MEAHGGSVDIDVRLVMDSLENIEQAIRMLRRTIRGLEMDGVGTLEVPKRFAMGDPPHPPFDGWDARLGPIPIPDPDGHLTAGFCRLEATLAEVLDKCCRWLRAVCDAVEAAGHGHSS